jgi:hypothetical protein
MISSAYEASYVLQWAVICVLIAGLAGLYSAFGALTRQLGRLGLPAATPDLSAMGPMIGDEVPLENGAALGAPFDNGVSFPGSASAWAFVAPGCAGCARTKSALQNATRGDFPGRVAVVVNGPREHTDVWARDLPAWVSVVRDEDGKLFGLFNVKATPYYVLLDEQARCIAKGPSEAVLLSSAEGSRDRDVAVVPIRQTTVAAETSPASRA